MNPKVSSLHAESGKGTDYLSRVAAIAPVIAGAAAQAERERRLPPVLVDALHEQGLLRLLLPRQFGGGEVDPVTYTQVVGAVAAIDGSTAWCLGQQNGCTLAAAYLEPEAAQAIWGDDPQAAVAWGPGKGTAVRTEGGWRLTGKWSFASGVRHATWVGGYSTLCDADGTPQSDADGNRVFRTLLVPVADVTLTEAWDVIGLRATGSDAFAIEDQFVADTFVLDRDEPTARRYDVPLYQFTGMNHYAAAFSATAMGIAGAMLSAFTELAADKTPRLARQALRDNAVVQSDLAQAVARLGAARSFLLSELSDIWASVEVTGRLSVEQRMRIRLASTHGIHEAHRVGDSIYDMSGATAIFTTSPFERRYRDLRTVTQQVQGRKSHFESVGAFLLGQPPDMTCI